VVAEALTDRIAIISDVHGNVTALEAVLTHIKEAGITRIFNLGDLVGKGPRSAEALDRCREVCEVVVQGNWDADIETAVGWPTADWHRQRLDREQLDYLAGLPGTFQFLLSGRRVRLFHASQISPFNRVHADAGPAVLDAMFDNTDFTGSAPEPDVVGYGDIHQTWSLTTKRGTLFNAGSVGNPLDIPLASYAVLEGQYGDDRPAPWSLNFVRLPYDIDAEIRVAEATDMPDLTHYVNELRTAKYRGKT
jgi:protein phosphatase